MKLLRNPKAMENLQALIYSCATQPSIPSKIKDVHKIYRYKKHTGREMRLTAQIGDYKMDQVILDLGSVTNYFVTMKFYSLYGFINTYIMLP